MVSKPGLRFTKEKIVHIILRKDQQNLKGYNKWLLKKLNKKALQLEYDSLINTFKIQPLISIVIPVYNPPIHFLEKAIESITDQSYTKWEICISDDRSPNTEVQKVLQDHAATDPRIKIVLRDTNGHISANSNSALALATGDFILFMDHDDLLTSNCLFEIVKHINQHPDDLIIYSDEDKIDDTGLFSIPHFKPDWAPDNLLSRNYFGHVVVMQKKLVDSIGGFREGFEGSQDYDIILRATERTTKIGHISKVLYHWRIHEESVAQNSDAKPYAYIAAKKALEEALERRNTPGTVEYIPDLLGAYRIKYDITAPGKVSIIIPTKDQVKLLSTTLNSIISHTNYPDYEIILLNNNSTSKEFFDLVAEFKQKLGDRFACYDANYPFNFSKLMNFGVSKSSGKYLLFLNNDIEIIKDDWMHEMVSHAQHEHTGAVGVKLLYPNNTIQHAGVILGPGEAAAHVFVNLHKTESGYYNYVLSLNNYAAVTAACMMCRRSLFDKVDGFDERLAVEYNDIDFCLKLLDAGYYNVYVPDVEVYHFESATRSHPYHSKEAFAQHEIDKGVFKSKWAAYIDNDPFYNPNLTIEGTEFRVDLKS